MNFPPKFNEKWSGSGPQETESQNLEELRVGLFIRSQNVRAGRKSGIYLAQCFSIWDYFEGKALGRPDQINFYLFYILGFPWEKYIFISTHLSIYLYQISSIYIYIYTYTTDPGFPCGLVVKNLPEIQKTWVQPLGWEDLLEKEMVTHSSILAWWILWTEEPGGLQSMGLQWVRLNNNTTNLI